MARDTVAYFAGMHAFYDGATIGKAVLGLAVRAADGSPVRLGRAIGRATATFLLWIVVVGGLVDMLVGAADGRRQWLHDKIAGTDACRSCTGRGTRGRRSAP
ncbi:MAG: RDD family protein [Chloroflexota bacterium]